MAAECQITKCTHPYTTRQRNGIYCKCVVYHRSCEDLPMCLKDNA